MARFQAVERGLLPYLVISQTVPLIALAPLVVSWGGKLIWPSAGCVGVIDQAAWDRTVQIAMDTQNLECATVLTAPSTDGAWTNDIVNEALQKLEGLGVDTKGSDFQPTEVTLEEGGN